MEGFYGSIDIPELIIDNGGKLINFNVANEVNVINNFDLDIIIIDLEVLDEDIERTLRNEDCDIIIKMRSKTYNTGERFMHEEKYKNMRLIKKTMIMGLDEIHRYAYVLANARNCSDMKLVYKEVDNYLKNRFLSNISVSTEKLSYSVAESLNRISERMEDLNTLQKDIVDAIQSMKSELKEEVIKKINNAYNNN